MTDIPTTTPSTEPSLTSVREDAVARLAEHASRGEMTLGEYADRVRAAYDAQTPEAAEATLEGLDRRPGTSSAATPRARWLVAILGGTQHTGRWRLARRLRIVALLGGAELDLGQAEVEAAESTVTVLAVFGGVDIKAPAGLPIQFSGFALFGGRSDERGLAAPLPGAPLVRIRAFCFFGGAKVEERRPPGG